ncbi:monovalent cation/H+ antiporter complex subunit F [Thiolapillus sp.]
MKLNIAEYLALALMGIAMLLSLYRLLRGPSAVDRVVAADTLSVIITGTIAMLAWFLQSVLYLDVALVYGVLAFVGTVAVARTIEGGRS